MGLGLILMYQTNADQVTKNIKNEQNSSKISFALSITQEHARRQMKKEK